MISRRHFLGASAAALAAPAFLGTAGRAFAATRPATTASTLTIDLVNNSGTDTAYAYVTGLAIDNGNAWFLLQADGQTPYYPASPSSTGSPLAVDCSIPLAPSGGGVKSITIPRLAGGRFWFSLGQPLTFLLNPGPQLVEPSVTNPSDPNIDIAWDFCEFTYNDANMYANISFVDFVSLPIALTLTGSAGTQTVPGLRSGGVDSVASALAAQSATDGQGWNELIVTSNGANLRVLSPYNGIVEQPSLFSGYFDGYVEQVWSTYTNQPLTIDTQGQWGSVPGQVSGGQLTFAGVGSFGQPTSGDIFSCSTGVFAVSGAEMGAIAARIAAAFNRSTLLIDSDQPDGENPATYYTNAVTNHYAKAVHAATVDGRGYAFPYDDVAPTGGADQSGYLTDPAPTGMTITLGAPH